MAFEPMEDIGMARKRHKAEEIVSKLRQVDVLTSQGRPEMKGKNVGGEGKIAVVDGGYFGG
jgi:hypothetical protein